MQQGCAVEYTARLNEYEKRAREVRERLQRTEQVVKELEGKAAELLLTQKQLADITTQRQVDLDSHQRDRLRIEGLDSELRQCQSAQQKDRERAEVVLSELRQFPVLHSRLEPKNFHLVELVLNYVKSNNIVKFCCKTIYRRHRRLVYHQFFFRFRLQCRQ